MKTIKSVTLIVILILLNCANILSQNCPPDSVDWSGTLTKTSQFDIYPGSASVSYQKGTLGSGYVVKVDWNSLVISNSPTISESAWRKILEYDLIKEIIPYNSLPNNYQTTVAFYYQRECKTQTKIALNLALTETIYCCPGDSPVINQIRTTHLNGGTQKVYYMYKDVVCGYKCCKRVYNCTVTVDNLSGVHDLIITNRATFSITTCSGNSTNIDCITNLPTPCNDGSCD